MIGDKERRTRVNLTSYASSSLALKAATVNQAGLVEVHARLSGGSQDCLGEIDFTAWLTPPLPDSGDNKDEIDASFAIGRRVRELIFLSEKNLYQLFFPFII